MSNTYVITSMVTVNDAVTVTGTVNGVAVTVSYPFELQSTFPDIITFLGFIEPLMLAAVPTPITGFTGTFTG